MTTAREARTERWRRYSHWSMAWRFATLFNLVSLVFWLAQLGLAALGWTWIAPSAPPHTGGEIAEVIFHGLFVGLFGGFFASFVIDRTTPPSTPPAVP